MDADILSLSGSCDRPVRAYRPSAVADGEAARRRPKRRKELPGTRPLPVLYVPPEEIVPAKKKHRAKKAACRVVKVFQDAMPGPSGECCRQEKARAMRDWRDWETKLCRPCQERRIFVPALPYSSRCLACLVYEAERKRRAERATRLVFPDKAKGPRPAA